ncbi:DUF1173 domain-containing protein [Burkholderia glumae]|uniref:DUF1173 domain-containing protein n=1 Tax=Burkholderia glumae TaxID=337 RepID=A0AAP9Y6W5_BURGL|nr:DUF1173 domain-containing protein [Burkholderia glumae]AJY62455.1 hypothetical protein KS03_5671 [Burkholderia glumae LMG 2196 = ATCC 33617]KHJ63771.1 hypothetical protein NCPPB3923_06405 [Burkholderia glumae]MCM2485633.1 DUF1173 domain-containing protein [Burkholderia glumae]MCM2506146.1 DUF1173 domain-containing protein [Burkholderia glumae]MCM2541813.1 DUF1173 domain-containing protein [Burkholderia glumae]
MQRYELDGEEFDGASNSFLARLPAAHDEKKRPLCLCQSPGIPMYIARFEDRFIVKRMPGTARQHSMDPMCDSYEAPAGLSGYGDVDGSAIVEDPDSGLVTLKFGFPLAKGPSRQMPEPSGAEPESVKADGKKLTLRGLLHYLWEQACLNRWTPAMAGKRGWGLVRRELLKAAAGKQSKKFDLTDLLYIPETFVLDQEDQIEQRRAAHLARISQSEGGKPHYILVIGELKEIATARFGFKLVIKHLPRFGLMLDEATKKRIEKVFKAELEMSASTEGTHLIVIATASVSASGTATVHEVSMMLTTENWIPFENLTEHTLLKSLAKRRFLKCLRYNQAATTPIANVLLTDAEKETALFVVPADASTSFESRLDALIKESDVDTWIWRLSAGPMPALPRTAYEERAAAAARRNRAPQTLPPPDRQPGPPRDAPAGPDFDDADSPGNWL